MHTKMYNTIKLMIERKRFASLEDCLSKIIVYNTAHLITDEEVIELSDMAREVYGE